MRKTMTITGNNRPFYLREMLSSLRRNDVRGYVAHFFLEPGCPENVRVAEEASSWLDLRIHVNSRRLGVRCNPYNALETVFQDSEFNVYLEDDIVLSPDTFDLCNFYLASAECAGTMSLQLFNHYSYPGNKLGYWDGKPPVDDLCLGRYGYFPHFCALGFAATRESWRRHFRMQWWQTTGWDCGIEHYLREHRVGRKTWLAQPLVSRSNHIGRAKGTHCGSAFHDRAFAHIQIATVAPRSSYRVRCHEYGTRGVRELWP